jgi:hypothetical protein
MLPEAKGADTPIRISIQQSTLDNHEQLLAFFERPLHEIDVIPPGRFSRPDADIIIIAKALHTGGLRGPLEFIPACNARRETEEVALGNTVIAAQQFDRSVLNHPHYAEAFHISAPITRIGEFQKGFYCLDTNQKVLDIKSAEELNRKSKGAIGLHWENDAQILQSMGIDKVIKVPTFSSIIKMIAAGRADWIPLELSSSEDLSMTLYGHRLVPIPGIKFSLIESRHFLVSRIHPDGERVFNALQKGLAELRKQGFIRNTLTATGFFSGKTDDWTLLNEAAVKRAKAEQAPDN